MHCLSPITPIIHPLFTKKKLNVLIKRDDLIHPIISGNKWRKLQENIVIAKTQGYKGILSFGGAYSNHVHALAFACYQENINCIGIIRGESHYENNATLTQARKWKMDLKFITRQEYRERNDSAFIAQLQARYPDYYIVPEGGSNKAALVGVGNVIQELDEQCEFDTLIVAVGSGGTLAGIVNADENRHALYGVPVLKNAEYLYDSIKQLLPDQALTYNNWQLLLNYHGGGYGKFSEQDANTLIDFIKKTKIPLEPIYSGKMILALLDLVKKDHFKPGEKIVLVHTGGLQGLQGLSEQNRIHLPDWNIS